MPKTERLDPITYLRDWAKETTADAAHLQQQVNELSAMFRELLDAVAAHQIPLSHELQAWWKVYSRGE